MKKTMTLTVNDFPVYINEILIQKAKNSKVSKNEYLTNLLRTHTLSDEINEVKNSYEELLKHTLVALNNNTEVMQQIIEMIEG
ncbi:hypothetical protein [Paraclostridium bifermentans]|uniref:hypothetical protein n=1 Tax=Paraclostridium bifermentans TaxID=1490 RepID=UPI00189B90C7|nr:hypothetical protein [Paraclostridium bifermentans]